MDLEQSFPAIPEDTDLAFLSDALFEQYDEEPNSSPALAAANDEEYENLYPSLTL